MPAIAANNTVNNSLVELNVLISSAWVRTVKSSCSSFVSLCELRSI
jgi:hypothetical protein